MPLDIARCGVSQSPPLPLREGFGGRGASTSSALIWCGFTPSPTHSRKGRGSDPALLWQYYTQLVAVEEAFKNLKGDLAIRPVFHQAERRVEAHIFIAFLAYCLQITLQRRLHALAPGLTARSALEKFAAVQMIDVRLPTADGREPPLANPLHPTRARTQAPDPAAQAPVATTATTADRYSHRPQPTLVVQTFPSNPLIGNGRRIENTPNPAPLGVQG
jgi:hypothetical protein